MSGIVFEDTRAVSTCEIYRLGSRSAQRFSVVKNSGVDQGVLTPEDKGFQNGYGQGFQPSSSLIVLLADTGGCDPFCAGILRRHLPVFSLRARQLPQLSRPDSHPRHPLRRRKRTQPRCDGPVRTAHARRCIRNPHAHSGRFCRRSHGNGGYFLPAPRTSPVAGNILLHCGHCFHREPYQPFGVYGAYPPGPVQEPGTHLRCRAGRQYHYQFHASPRRPSGFHYRGLCPGGGRGSPDQG